MHPKWQDFLMHLLIHCFIFQRYRSVMFSPFPTLEKEFMLLTVCAGIVLNELKKHYVGCTQLSTLNWKMNMDYFWSK